jgi:hypothetical protein
MEYIYVSALIGVPSAQQSEGLSSILYTRPVSSASMPYFSFSGKSAVISVIFVAAS